MLSKAVKHLIENKLPKTFLVNIKKSQLVIKKREKRKENVTVFEPKHPCGCYYGTDAIPLSQKATV